MNELEEYVCGTLHRVCAIEDELKKAKAKALAYELRLIDASEYAEKFCKEQCEEGPEWGECKDSGCNLYFIKITCSFCTKGEEK